MILGILTTFLGNSGCSSSAIYFDPDAEFLRRDSQADLIYLLDERGTRIYQTSTEFYRRGCMRPEKWKELFELLKSSGADRQADIIRSVLKRF